MNDASDNHGDQEKSVSTYSVDIETLQQAALAGDPRHCSNWLSIMNRGEA